MALDIDPNVHGFTKVEYEDLDVSAFDARPLSNPTLRALRYMFDVERHTICYLRDLLVTPTHKDAAATAFLTRWAYEDFWHSEAVATVLRAHDVVIDNALIQRMRNTLGWRDSLAPVYRSVLANVVGDDITGVHMVWGAVNERCAQLAYDRIGELDPHPVLVELLARVRRQRQHHSDFYLEQARTRLARSARARRISRWWLRHMWGPIGSTIHPWHETGMVFAYLLAGPRGTEGMDRIDAELDTLPGLEGLHTVRRAFGRHNVGPDAEHMSRTLPVRLRVAPTRRSWRRAGL